MPHVTLKASFVAALSKAWTGAWMRKALLVRAFVCLSVGAPLVACTRSHPRLDELVALCGVHSQDARGDSVAVVVDENGKPHSQAGLSFKVFPAQLAKGAVAIDRGCVRFARGKSAGAVVLVTTDDGRRGAVLAAADFADENMKPVSLRPIESRDAFETCGLVQVPQGRLLRLFRTGGEPVMHDGAFLQALGGTQSGSAASAKNGAINREATPALSPLGCLAGNANDVWLVQSRDGAQATYVDRESWNAGRAFLDDRMPAVAFKTCRVAFSGRLREELLANKWTLAIPSGSGATDSAHWSICGRKGGCAKNEWTALADSSAADISGVKAARAGRCVASSRTASEFILRADEESRSSFARITASVAEQSLANTAPGKANPSQQLLVPRPFTMVPYLSATAFARDVSIRLPQCVDGQIRTSPNGALDVALGSNAADSAANAIGDGRIAIALAGSPVAFASSASSSGPQTGPQAAPLAVNSLPAEMLRAAESDTPPVVTFVATDVFGQSAHVRQDSACALRVRSVTFPSLAPIVDAYATTHDVSSVLATGIPTVLSDGTRLRVAYRLADRASPGVAPAASFNSVGACLVGDGYREATDGLIPLTIAGRYRLDLRVCADNGEAAIAPSRGVHVDGAKPVFDVFFWSPVAGLASPLVTRLGETLRLRIRDLHDDILPFEELVAGVTCKVKIIRPDFEMEIASKCRTVRAIAPYGEVQIEVEWLPLTWESEIDLRTKILGSRLRVILSVPTGDERSPTVTHWKEFVVPNFLAGGWRPLTMTLPEEMKHQDVMAIGAHDDGGALMMTNDMRIWRSLENDSGWALVARATSSYPGIRKYDGGGADPISSVRGDLGNPDPVVEELDSPGHIYDIGRGQIALALPQPDKNRFAWRAEPSSEDSLAFLGYLGALPWIRAVCKGSICKSGQELRDDTTLPWIETTGKKWIAIDDKEIRVGEVGIKGHRTYKIPPGLSRSVLANSLIIDPFDRVWQYDPGNEWKLKRIVDLSSQREINPSSLFPLLTLQSESTKMSFTSVMEKPVVVAWSENKSCWNNGDSSACIEIDPIEEITSVRAHGERLIINSSWVEDEPSWLAHQNWAVIDLKNGKVLANGKVEETCRELLTGFGPNTLKFSCSIYDGELTLNESSVRARFNFESAKWEFSPHMPVFGDFRELTFVHNVLSDGRKFLAAAKLRPWVESTVTVSQKFDDFAFDPIESWSEIWEGIEPPVRVNFEVGKPLVETFSDVRLILDSSVLALCFGLGQIIQPYISITEKSQLCEREIKSKGVASNQILAAFDSQIDSFDWARWLFFSPGLKGIQAVKNDGALTGDDVRIKFYFDGKLITLLDNDTSTVLISGLQKPNSNSIVVPKIGSSVEGITAGETLLFLAMTSAGPSIFEIPFDITSKFVNNYIYENFRNEIAVFSTLREMENSGLNITQVNFRRGSPSEGAWVFVESKSVRCAENPTGAARVICMRERQWQEQSWDMHFGSGLPPNGEGIRFEPRWPLDTSKPWFMGPLDLSPSNFEGMDTLKMEGWSKIPTKLIN